MSVRFNNGPKFKRFMDLIEEGFQLFGRLTYANHIPILRYFPGIHGIRNKIMQNRAEMAQFNEQIINDHKKDFNKDHIRDIVDAYLYKIQQAEEEGRDCELFQDKNKGKQKSSKKKNRYVSLVSAHYYKQY